MAALKKFAAVFEALRKCACAVERGDGIRADNFMKRALDLAEDDNERLVRFFAQALARRAYRLLPKYPPDFRHCYIDNNGFYSFTAAILIGDIIGKADLSGKSTIHLIFFSLNFFSLETLNFMKERLEKVPQMCLKITLVQTSNNSCTTIEKFVSQLAEGIKFEINRVINQRLDELEVSRLKIDRDDEFVVVNCFFLFGCMLPVALNKFLLMLRNDINPDIFYLVEYDANLNQDEFLMRFDESFWHFSCIYTLIENYLYYDVVQRFQDEISNVVACEGGARMVRHMTSDQWRDLLNKSGFSSIPVLYDENRLFSDFFNFEVKNGCVKLNVKGLERPLFFYSAWEIKESSFDEDIYHNSLDGDHNFQYLPISPDPQHCSLIRMASLAEIHDMTYQIFKYYGDDYHVKEILVWGKCGDDYYGDDYDGRSSQLNPCLCIVDQIKPGLRTNKIPKYHLQERNYVSKTFESNQPCFVPDMPYEEKGLSIGCVYRFVNGAFAIKLNSRHANCEGYVVVFLFDFPYGMVDEERRGVMDKILCNLRSEKSYFVTRSTPDDFLGKLEATPDVVRIIDNPSVQSQSHNNVMDRNVPLLQLPHQSSTPNAMPTSHQNDLLDSPTAELLNLNEVSDAQGDLFLSYGSSTQLAKPTRDQNILVDSSTRDIDLNDEISFDNWQFGNLTVGDDMDVQVSSWPPHQLDKEQGALKNVPFTPSEASQHPSKPNASEGQRDCVTEGRGKTVFRETIPSNERVSNCGRVEDNNIPLNKAKKDELLKMFDGKYGSTLVQTNIAKRPEQPQELRHAVGLTQGSFREPQGRRVRPKLMEGRKSSWSKNNVRDYLTWHFTLEEENLLEKWSRRKFSGQVEIKHGGWEIKDISLAPLVIPLDKNIIQNMPENFYIDDTVIDVYFYLLKRRCDIYPNKYLKHYSFSCFTASKLFSKRADDLSTWFNLEDLKGACKLFLPLCLPNSSHWVLFCADVNSRQFLWLDSLENSRKSHESDLKVILKWFIERVLPHLDNKDASKWKLKVPEDIPTQENMFDCGVFVMKYADCLTHGDHFPFSQAHMPHFRRRIFLDIAEWNIQVPHRFISN